LPAAVAQAIHARQPPSAATKELAQAQAAGIRLLTWDEPEYPQRLRQIYDLPPLLYVRGNIELLNRHQISIVGSRRSTPYGNQMAERLARDWADRGLVIVSGLARGLGSSAHQGALSSAAGATRGVLGCGIDVIYPKENKEIFAEMETRGAIISEFTMGTFPDQSCHVDELVERSGLTSSEVLGGLFDLELKGVVRQLPGKQFLKVLL
jgi:DNA processing protein